MSPFQWQNEMYWSEPEDKKQISLFNNSNIVQITQLNHKN